MADGFEAQLEALRIALPPLKPKWAFFFKALGDIGPLPPEANDIHLGATIEEGQVLPAHLVFVRGARDGRAVLMPPEQGARVKAAQKALNAAIPDQLARQTEALHAAIYETPDRNAALRRIFDDVWFPFVKDCVPPGALERLNVPVQAGLYDLNEDEILLKLHNPPKAAVEPVSDDDIEQRIAALAEATAQALRRNRAVIARGLADLRAVVPAEARGTLHLSLVSETPQHLPQIGCDLSQQPNGADAPQLDWSGLRKLRQCMDQTLAKDSTPAFGPWPEVLSRFGLPADLIPYDLNLWDRCYRDALVDAFEPQKWRLALYPVQTRERARTGPEPVQLHVPDPDKVRRWGKLARFIP